jgi:UDP-N-acetylmuramate dehydrogenase
MMVEAAPPSSRCVSGDTLLSRLPKVRGRLTANAPIGPLTWFRVGGPAEVLFRPEDEDDLAAFLAATAQDIPVTVIGVGSNLLVRDGGIPGVTIRLGRGFAGVHAENETVRAGAGALDLNVALAAAEADLSGLEFLSGIPGTIGGGLRMNAGAYGSEVNTVLLEASAVDRDGVGHRIPAAEMDLSYRHCGINPDWIFTGALLRGRCDAPDAIARRMREIKEMREASQPVRARTGGSTFANPPGHHAWQLIDAAGCRGLVRGGAMVSEKHANFLINTGSATAADIEGLGEEVRRRVCARFGITLEWEIRRIGVYDRTARPAEDKSCGR